MHLLNILKQKHAINILAILIFTILFAEFDVLWQRGDLVFASEVSPLQKDRIYDLDSGLFVRRLPMPINSLFHDFSPTVSREHRLLIFGSDRPGGHGLTDLYESRWQDGSWSIPRNISEINSEFIEETPFLSQDGTKLYFSSNRKGSIAGSSDIYVSERNGDRWGRARRLGTEVNSIYSEKTPNVSIDGNALLFTRFPKGKLKDARLMIASINKTGRLERAVSLPQPLNTRSMDACPVFHPEGTGIFFSSYRNENHWDIYWAPFDKEQGFSRIYPLPRIVNSPSYEAFFSISGDGRYIYFSRLEKDENSKVSDRHFNIYVVSLERLMKAIVEEQSKEKRYIELHFFDAKNKKPLAVSGFLHRKNAVKDKVENGNSVNQRINTSREDLSSKEYSFSSQSSLAFVGAAKDTWVLHIAREGYLPLSTEIRYPQDIFLQPVRAGAKIILSGIEFDFDKSFLKKRSLKNLKIIYEFLRKNPDLTVEIGGHTDNIGSSARKKELSLERAQVVRDFLTGRGIDSSRMQVRGYGDTKPMSDNSTDEGRQKNRRTELRILKP